jgi:hypothetical protein
MGKYRPYDYIFNTGYFLILMSSALLRGVKWFWTDVSGLLVCPIFKGQAFQEKLHYTLEDETDR